MTETTDRSSVEPRPRPGPRRWLDRELADSRWRTYLRYSLAAARFAGRATRAASRPAGPGRPSSRRHRVWEQVPQLLEDLGPAFIKMGQLASTRRDVLSDGACDELARLLENTTPMSASYANMRLAAIGAVDSPCPPQAVGHGSIAGVYRVRHHGRDAAAKLRRDNVRDRLVADCATARRAARLLSVLPPVRKLPFREMVDFIVDATQMQVDLRREAVNLAQLSETLAHLPITLPEVYESAEDGSALVMQFLPAFDDRREPEDGKVAATSLLEAAFTMIFRSGFVHLDLHRGNYAWDADDRLQLIDAGFAVQLTPNTRRQFSEFFIGLSFGNGARAARSIIASAVSVPEKFDEEAFTADITDLIVEHRRLPARDFRIAPFTQALFSVQRRHGIFIRSDFAAPVLALMTVEGQVREWAPELDFQVIAQAIIIGSIALIPPG